MLYTAIIIIINAIISIALIFLTVNVWCSIAKPYFNASGQMSVYAVDPAWVNSMALNCRGPLRSGFLFIYSTVLSMYFLFLMIF